MADSERILVTGGSGFLGAGLTRALLAAGHDVHLLARTAEKAWRLAGIRDRCTIHEADLRDVAALERAVQACQPTIIYHLAAYGVRPVESDIALLHGTNVQGTANLLRALRVVDYRAFVHVGSGAEYGPRDDAIHEDAPLRPATPYATVKAAASVLCAAEAGQGRPVVIVRAFAAYGPWEAPTRLPSYVMDCCLRNESPRVSAGDQRRDFIAADDVIALLLRAAKLPEVAGQVLHAGTGREATVREGCWRVC